MHTAKIEKTNTADASPIWMNNQLRSGLKAEEQARAQLSKAEALLEEGKAIQSGWDALVEEFNALVERENNASIEVSQYIGGESAVRVHLASIIGQPYQMPKAGIYAVEYAAQRAASGLMEQALADLRATLRAKRAELVEYCKAHALPTPYRESIPTILEKA